MRAKELAWVLVAAFAAIRKASTAHRRPAERAEVHKSTVDGANTVRIVERPVEPT